MPDNYPHLSSEERAGLVEGLLRDTERICYHAEVNLAVEAAALDELGVEDEADRRTQLSGVQAHAERSRARLAALRARPELANREVSRDVPPPPPAPSFSSESPA